MNTDVTYTTDLTRNRLIRAVVLAMVTSLATIAISSRRDTRLYLWASLALVPAMVSAALMFKRRISVIPSWLYASMLILLLIAALFFGL